MIPYGTFTFFLIAFIVLLPVIIMGLVGKRSRIYNGISTMVMIVLIFSSEKHNLFGLSFLSVQLINFIHSLASSHYHVLLEITCKK